MRIVRCPRCHHIWPYRGSSPYRTPCSSCRTNVPLTGGKNCIPISLSPSPAAPGQAVLRARVFNGEADLVALIRSDDDQFDLIVPLGAERVGGPQFADYLARYPKVAGAHSGIWHLDEEARRLLRPLFD